MICPKCKIGMKEQGRVFHKRRKWICPKCGKVRFQAPKRPAGGKESKDKK